MPFGAVTLIPGANVERTPTALRTGFSQTNLVRFRDNLVQKYGGWQKFYNMRVGGIPRDLHAWQDLNQVTHLAVGTTTQLGVITSGSLTVITPQTLKSDFAPNISTTSGSTAVAITDPNISNVTVLDSVFFNVPVSLGGLILDGLYPISLISGTHSYQITVPTAATATDTNPTATNGATAVGNNTLHFAATPVWVVAGMVIADLTTPSAIPASTTVVSTTGTTVVMSNNAAGASGVGNGDNITFVSVPVFTTVSGSANVTVNFIAHGRSVGDTVVFATATSSETMPTNATTAAGNATLHFSATPAWIAAGMVVTDLTTPSVIPANTTVLSTTATTAVLSNNVTGAGVGNGDNISFANGITISGSYSVITVTDANNLVITASTQALASAAFAMNGGNAELLYYIAIGPPPLGVGYGIGNYGAGGYGIGVASGVQNGTTISASDWTTDNWGEILLSCPRGGGIYYYDPTGGFSTAALVQTGPILNTGIFVSMSQQILVAIGSSIHQGIGYQQQPLLVKWSTVGNFFNWTVSAATQAGSYTIGIGSAIIAGMAVSNQNLIWTDLDLWAMNYIGPPDVFGFNKIGAGAGAASLHSVQQLRGSVYWMGRTNFYAYTSGGVSVIPCPVWDAVFQNLNTNFVQNIRAMPNTPFNEVGWFYPSAASSGECDSYVKFNITESGAPWDFGSLGRSAWIDQTVLGEPIGASSVGVIFQHETTPDADGTALVSSFTTGEFYIGEGQEIAFVDQVLPDFKWSVFTGGSSAQVQISFNLTYFPGDTPTVYGPYTVTSATEFISTRMRGRLMSITVSSSDLGSFWRLGSCKYRWSVAGRR